MERCNEISTVKPLGVDITYNSPISHQPGLIRPLFYRVQKIYTQDQVLEEEFVRRMSLADGYREHFIEQLYEKSVTVEKQVFIVLQFKGDRFSHEIN